MDGNDCPIFDDHMALTDLELHYYMIAVPRENTRYHSTIVAHNSVFLPCIYPDISGYLIWADKMSGYLSGEIWNFSGFFVQNSSEIRFKTFTNCLLEASY